MRHSQKHPNAIDFTKRYVINEREKYNLKEEFENIYYQLAYAYLVLYHNTPNFHLDLNDGNIGFTSDVNVFDMQ